MSELDELQIYLGKSLQVNDKITIPQARIRDIMELGERTYYSIVQSIVSIPSDHKSMLWDVGIDWMEISDFDFFCLMHASRNFPIEQTRYVLGELDLSKFNLYKNDCGDAVLYDAENDIVIDQHIHHLITNFLCKCNMITPKVEKAGNHYTKMYLIDEDRKKRERAAESQDEHKSVLQPRISALVNSAEFKYNIDQVLDLTLYQLRDSIARIGIIRDVTVLHNGLYANGVDRDKLDKKLLDWTRRLK